MNKKMNIHEEIARADKAMEAVTVLFDNALYNDAVSKLYYLLLYNVRALLLTKGLEPRSHEGALRLLSLHFIKEAVFQPSASHLFSKLMKYREEADYNPSYVFVAEDFVLLKKETMELSAMIKDYLREKGFM